MPSTKEDIYSYINENYNEYISVLGAKTIHKIIDAEIEGRKLDLFSSKQGSNLELGNIIAAASLIVSILATINSWKSQDRISKSEIKKIVDDHLNESKKEEEKPME